MRDHADKSDFELLKMLKRHDDAPAFREIYDRYWSKLYAAAFKRLKDTSGAEEVVQDVFTKLWIRRTDLNIQTVLAAYLFTATRYQVINYLHKEYVKTNYLERARIHFNDFDNTAEETLIANDLNQHIQQGVELLPDKCRTVFELSRKEHKSNKEIAETLGISEKTVENHITRALRKLKTSINSFLLLF